MAPEGDQDLAEFLMKLREGILETYISIVNGTFDAGQTEKTTLTRYTQNILAFTVELLNNNDTKYFHGNVRIIIIHLDIQPFYSTFTKMSLGSMEIWQHA